MDNQTLLDPLGGRELDVLRLLAENKSNREIGDELFISAETVKWYNKQIYSKLDVGDRRTAVQKAHSLGLLDRAAQVETSAPYDLDLPVHLTSFIGRDEEIEDIKDLLETNRLVTLVGPGGTGKTRLAIQVVLETVSQYEDGVAFVDLAPVTDPDLMLNAIANSLGIVEHAGKDMLEAVRIRLADKHMLIIIDNAEHLLDSVSLLSELLAFSPIVYILATSREPLRLYGEQQYAIPPLQVPDLETTQSASELVGYEAVTLFTQRAQAIDPAFQLTEENAEIIARICARLDGLPLAIELAAARIRLFPPEKMLSKLEDSLRLLTGGPRDVHPRQQTLRDAIAWSYNLLDEGEKILFARLGVFSGGRTMDAIEAVCAPGITIDVYDGIYSLLSKSLLYQEESADGEPRFLMLETLHEYASECLVQSGEEEAIRQRHLAFYIQLAEEMELGYRYHNQIRLFKRTAAEMGNIRAAFEWAYSHGDYEATARLISPLHDYFFYWGHHVEGFRMTQQLLPYFEEFAFGLQARFLLAAAMVSWNIPDGLLKDLFTLALEAARRSGDSNQVGWAQMIGSGKLALSGRGVTVEQAEELVLESRDMFLESGNKAGVAQAYNMLGELARMRGDYVEARRVYEECLTVLSETGESLRESMIEQNLGFVSYHEGDYEQSLAQARSGLKSAQSIGSRFFGVCALAGAAGPLSKLGFPERAARLMGATDAQLVNMGLGNQPGDQFEIDMYIAEIKSVLGEEAYQREYEIGLRMSLNEAVAYTLEEVET